MPLSTVTHEIPKALQDELDAIRETARKSRKADLDAKIKQLQDDAQSQIDDLVNARVTEFVASEHAGAVLKKHTKTYKAAPHVDAMTICNAKLLGAKAVGGKIEATYSIEHRLSDGSVVGGI